MMPCAKTHCNTERIDPPPPSSRRRLYGSSEVSGGAVTYTGILKILDTTFEANQADKEGFAIMSLGVLEDGSLSRVIFDSNVPNCPAGQYGYEEAVENSVIRVFI